MRCSKNRWRWSDVFLASHRNVVPSPSRLARSAMVLLGHRTVCTEHRDGLSLTTFRRPQTASGESSDHGRRLVAARLPRQALTPHAE